MSVVLTDILSPYTSLGVNSYGTNAAFQFTDGTPVSGLSFGTPLYSNDYGASWTYTPVSGGEGHRRATMAMSPTGRSR